MRIPSPPLIDGRDDDPVWPAVPFVGEFREFAPREGATPVFRTEARVAYDDRALYVLVRAFDRRPDSLVRRLARRDTDGPPNDQVLLFIDPNYDRRSGFQFVVNPAGVKSDYLMSDDSNGDKSWDGVWEAATSVDSLGWVAEFAIPLQQLRIANYRSPTLGFTIGRWVGRNDERSSWPQYRRSRAGIMSQLGTLTGLRDVTPPASLELAPYVLGRFGHAASQSWSATPSAGGDLRFQPRPTIGLSATINPDFGQVEADPAVLNLTGFEVFLAERRPFFLEGSGLLRFPLAADGSALLFHSRRIGRRPALADQPGVLDAPQETTILAAGKGSMRLAPTTSVFALSALTASEEADRAGGGRALLEPRAHYLVARIQHEFRRGRSGIGAMATRVDRSGHDSLAAAGLPVTAQTGALTFQHQSGDGAYQVSGWAAASVVQASAAAISALQLSPVHAYQRPDDGEDYDAARTELRGAGAYLFAGKVAGGVTRFGAGYRRLSPGLDVNEMGFLAKAGVQSLALTAGLNATQAGSVAGIRFRRASVTLGFEGEWLTNGLPQGRGITLAGTLELPSQAQLAFNVLRQVSGAYCTTACTRGGPALVDPPRSVVLLTITGNPRRAIVPRLLVEWNRDDGGRSTGVAPQLDVTWRPRSNLDVSASAIWSGTTLDTYYYQRFGSPVSDTAHYVLGRLDQPVRSLTTRVNYALTTGITLQWYAQAYLSRANFSNLRELADPRATDYDARFRPWSDSTAVAGTDYRQFRSNLVARWEYRPGSTLFVVWTQGRDLTASGTGPIRLGPDLEGLFGQPAANAVAVKVSYWLNPAVARSR